MKSFSLLLCGLIAFPAVASTTPVLSGSVADAVSGEPLVAAHVYVLYGARGTITNGAGEYLLPLAVGRHRIVFSTLGYRADTLTIDLVNTVELNVRLHPAPIVLPEVLATTEDPAYEIIRRAIAARRAWIDKLRSYEIEAFTRIVLNRDTSIASITESYTRGYWRQGDSLREVVVQRRQTANIPEAQNFASVGRIVNFSEDNIAFLGYSFVGPTAAGAFDSYDYKLLRTLKQAGHDVYEIRMTPRTRTRPLFDGVIQIADGSYALVGVDIEPNEACVIPFVRERQLRYRQQFASFEGGFWMPVDVRATGSFSLGVLGFSFPRIGIEYISVLYNYTINGPIPDSIFGRPRLVVDSSAQRFDSTFWSSAQVLPLAPEEQFAYSTIDSTQTLDVQFRPGGLSASLGAAGAAGAVLEDADISFNRVEGLRLGAALERKKITKLLDVSAGLAYGLSDKRTKYMLGAVVYTSARRTAGVGAEVYRKMDHRPDRGYYGSLVISLAALLNKSDYRDYFESEGWKIFTEMKPWQSVAFSLGYAAERHTSVSPATAYSLFRRSRAFRDNPAIHEGTLRSVQLAVRVGDAPVPLEIVRANTLEIAVEHSDPAVTGGQFTFTRYDAGLTFVVPTFARSFLLPAQLRMRITGGASSGSLPGQRLFVLESGYSGLGPFGVLRGTEVSEYEGTGYLSVAVEHNFRSLLFLALGIPFLYENSIELLIHGAGGRTWGKAGFPSNTTEGWYYEAGIGISRILDFFRVDLTWRLKDTKDFRVTIGVAQLF